MFIPLQNSSNQLPEISNSLRFDGSNDYLTRSYTNTTFTQAALSVWVKRSKLGANQTIFGFGATGTGYIGLYIMFNTSDQLSIHYDDSINPIGPYTTSAVFRDPSAWYHIVIVWDTTQVTQVDRQKVWVNGTFQTTTNGLSLNASLYLRGTPDTATFGRRPYSGDYYFDGYIANPCVVFGSGLTASSFAYTDPNGQWRSLSKAALQSVVNAGGANSFFLSFDDGTSTTTLGSDASGKGNNWTLTNMVRTGGADDCWSYDTPTNNFATLNPLTNEAGLTPLINNGNLSIYNTYTGGYYIRSTIALPTSGKFYFEAMSLSANASLIAGYFGVCDVKGTKFSGFSSRYGVNPSGSGFIQQDVSLESTYRGGLNILVGVAIDRDANTVSIYLDGVLQTAFTPTIATGIDMFAMYGTYTSGTGWANFGQRPVASGQWYPDAGGYFRYAPPTGYKALSTKNLSTPSVIKPNKQFDITLWVGNATARNISGIGFQPDLVWGKSRTDGSANHRLIDSVRGTTKELYPSLTNAEATDVNGLTSFNADGFGLGVGSSLNNNVLNSYVGWLWKAGGAAVSNTAGTITSQVSANPTAGFSIVSYVGNGLASQTIGHGLGVVPKLIFEKDRDQSGVAGFVAHGCGQLWSPGTSGLFLYGTSGLNPSMISGDGVATSTIYKPAIPGYANVSGHNHIAYCFAEVSGFSKIGSYTGNGSADGPFVWCGFRPKYVLIKRSDASGDWSVYDAARDPYNVMPDILFPNLANAETGGYAMDFLASGFKLRSSTASNANTNGGTYIFMAFAEAPFKYANAR